MSGYFRGKMLTCPIASENAFLVLIASRQARFPCLFCVGPISFTVHHLFGSVVSMATFTLIPQDDPQQALRVRRMLMGLISYSLYTIVTFVCWYLGIFNGQMVLGYVLFISFLNLGLYWALRSGFSKRFSDPSLTLLQLLAAIPTGLYLMYFAQDKRLVFILLGVPVFLFGVFQFRLRQFVIVAICAVCGYSALVWVLWYQGAPLDLPTEFLTIFVLIGMMVQVSMLGAFIGRLRKKIKDNNTELAASNEELLARSAELTRAHREMEQTLLALRVAHEELVRKEKLAALGSLVAGIAHEINTPIGNSLLAASMLNDETRAFNSQYAVNRNFPEIRLNNFIDDAGSACDILLVNLRRAADLITSFKQVAIDQTSSQRRMFPLQEVVNEILMMLSPVLKMSSYRVLQDVPEAIMLDSYPGPLGQVLTNLLNNAMLHGFDGREHGQIEIGARMVGDKDVELWVCDDGGGIAPENLNRIFDPFFTTKLGTGGSGLGLNIAHNIVSGVLSGKISVESHLGQGTRFKLILPIVAQENSPPSVT